MSNREELRQSAREELRRRGLSIQKSPVENAGSERESLRQAAREELKRRSISSPVEENSKEFRWPRFLGEHAAKGVMDIADLVQHSPHLVGKGVEYLFPPDVSMIGKAGKYLAESTKPKRPISEETKEALIRDYGLDLDSQGSGNTPIQRIAGHGARFIGGSFIPIPGSTTVGSLAKNSAVSGAMGAGSGALQEAGVPQIPADIAAVVGGGLAPGMARKAFSRASELTPQEMRVGRNLQEFVGERQLPTVSENLLQKSGVPNYEPMTAELANNPSLSQIHRTRLGIPGSGLQDQASRQNESMMSLIEQNSLKAPSSSEIIQDVGDELKKRSITRHNATHEGYESVEKMKEKLTPSNLIKFLESKPAAGKIRADLNEIRKELKIPDKVSKIEKEYKKIYEKASPEVRKKMEPPISVSTKISELAAIDMALTAKIQKFEKSGEKARRKVLKLAQEELRKDLDVVETYGKARSEFARLSKPVNEIEQHKTLKGLPKSTVNNIMNDLYNRKSTDNMKQLKKVLGDDPEKWEGIQHATTEHLKNRVLNAGAEGRSHVISYPKMKRFMDSHGKALENVYNPEQMEVIKSIEKVLKGQNIAKTLGEGPGSPTQARQMIDKIMAKGLGVRGLEAGTKFLTYVPKHIPGLKWAGKSIEAPILGGLEYIAVRNEKKLTDILDKSLREPEFAHKLLTHDFKGPKDVSKFFDTAIPRTPILMRNRKDEERTGVTRNGKTFPYTLKAKQD